MKNELMNFFINLNTLHKVSYIFLIIILIIILNMLFSKFSYLAYSIIIYFVAYLIQDYRKD